MIKLAFSSGLLESEKLIMRHMLNVIELKTNCMALLQDVRVYLLHQTFPAILRFSTISRLLLVNLCKMWSTVVAE